MAKSFSELQTLAIQIRDELNKKKNSAQRVGSALLDIIDNCIQNITDIKQKLSVFEHACSGFKRVSSEAQLPVTPSQEDLAKGFLVNTSLYLYVGTGGNAVNGRYFNVGDIRGPQGEPGSKGETGNTGPTGEKGEQGNSGVTGDTSDIVVINNLDGGESEEGSIKVLAAEQGKVLNKKFTELVNNLYKGESKITPIFGAIGTIDSSSGINIEDDDRLRTDEYYLMDYEIKSSSALIIAYLYDENKIFLGVNVANAIQTSEIALEKYPTAKYARFSILSLDATVSGYALIGDGIFSINKEIEKIKNEIPTQIYDGGSRIVPIFGTVGTINSSTGVSIEDATRRRTDEYYYMDYIINSSAQIIAYIYDESKKYLGFIPVYTTQTSENALETYPTAKYARFSILSLDAMVGGYAVIADGIISVNKDVQELKNVPKQLYDGGSRIVPIFGTVGTINSSTGVSIEDATRRRTDEYYYMDYIINSSAQIIAYIYDESKKYLGFIPVYTTQTSENALETYPTAKYARFSILSLDAAVNGYGIIVDGIIEVAKKANEALEELKALKPSNSNILYGKKWAYCGDSFSAGGYSSLEITDADKMPSDSKFAGKNKVYGYIIADRNNMTIQDFAAGGRTIATPEDGSFTNCFSLLYKKIDSDVDYITLYFGINDSHHAPGGSAGDGEDNTGEIPIGTIDDDTINTFCGAYNVVLEYLMQNYPFAHIGIIVSNGCDTPEYAEKTIQIAKKWGIPYIDLNEAPVMIRSQSSIVSSTAKNIVNTKQRVSSTNMHPNTKAHEYESTFIENFLRSL